MLAGLGKGVDNRRERAKERVEIENKKDVISSPERCTELNMNFYIIYVSLVERLGIGVSYVGKNQYRQDIPVWRLPTAHLCPWKGIPVVQQHKTLDRQRSIDRYWYRGWDERNGQ